MARAKTTRAQRELGRWVADDTRRRRTKRALLASVILTLALYIVPFGNFLAYPLLLLSTLVHELGHGLVALATGGQFERLAIFSDGSGVAHSATVGERAAALVAAGGLVGPAILAAVVFALAHRPTLARMSLGLLGLGFLAALALWIRNPFGIGFAALVSLTLIGLAIRGRSGTPQIALVFLAIQLALSVFSRSDYLFVAEARTGAGTMPSDVARIAAALGGPYWAWGLACGAFSLLVVLAGVGLFWRSLRARR